MVLWRMGHGVVRMESEQTYFKRRAAQEATAADEAHGESARKAHLEMAERYRQRSEKSPASA